MNWLVRKLVDSGWVRLGLAFRWIYGTKEILTALVNENELDTIENRYTLIEQNGFFSGKNGTANQQAFIQALFAYDERKADAFSKALYFSYSWNEGSVEPLQAFLNFISRTFFRGPSTDDNKQTFIDAVLTQNNGESNALSHAAWAKTPEPVAIVLNSLTDAGCFESIENKQKLINGICTLNKTDENALYNALKNQPQTKDSSSNIKILLNALVEADCFNSDANKETFIQAALTTDVLGEAMWNHNYLQQILAALTKAGCFTDENGIQAFIDALITPNRIGANPLSYAAIRTDSLKLIYNQLKQIGCFNSAENKQKIINGIFSQDNRGNSVLHASEDQERSHLILDILATAGCFDGPTGSANQQAFVKAALAVEEHGYTFLFISSHNEQILNKLTEVQYFESVFAEQNKQAFIESLLAPTHIGEEQRESTLSRHCNSPTFPLFLEHLTAAGCFSGDSINSNKKAFMNAVFAKTHYGKSMLAGIHRHDNIIQLLKKLEEADCFNHEEYKTQFREAIRANANVFFSLVMKNDLRGYLVLHKSLLLAGFSVLDIKKLLNESIDASANTPLMIALRYKDGLFAARLIADGAALTEEQKQRLKRSTESQQKTENKVAPFDVESIKKELTQQLRKKPILERSGSLSDLSLFATKQSDTTSKYAVDDIAMSR